MNKFMKRQTLYNYSYLNFTLTNYISIIYDQILKKSKKTINYFK